MSFLGDRLTEKASMWGVHMGAPLFLNHRFMCLIEFCSRTLKLCEITDVEPSAQKWQCPKLFPLRPEAVDFMFSSLHHQQHDCSCPCKYCTSSLAGQVDLLGLG